MSINEEITLLRQQMYLEALKYSVKLLKDTNESGMEELSSGNLSAFSALLKHNPETIAEKSDGEDMSLKLQQLIKDKGDVEEPKKGSSIHYKEVGEVVKEAQSDNLGLKLQGLIKGEEEKSKKVSKSQYYKEG